MSDCDGRIDNGRCRGTCQECAGITRLSRRQNAALAHPFERSGVDEMVCLDTETGEVYLVGQGIREKIADSFDEWFRRDVLDKS